MSEKKTFFPPLVRRGYFLFILFFPLIISCQEGMERPPGEQTGQIAEEAALFGRECNKCHTLQRALNTFRDEEAWLRTIQRMREKNKVDIPPGEVDRLVRYHVERQKKEAATFQTKCQLCHRGNRFVEKALIPEQARALIRKMQEKAGNIITDEDVELLVTFHVREHQQTVKRDFRKALGGPAVQEQGANAEALNIFVQKCSSCHELERSLEVFKDEQAWKRTINTMQAYSRGYITEDEVESLVRFHVDRQKNELDVFRETCTRCHPEEQVTRRSMSEEEWMQTVKRMQEKTPEIYTEEKIKILAIYHKKHEMVMTKLFYGQCNECHTLSNSPTPSITARASDTLITAASEKLAPDVSVPDIRDLINFHKEREKREMQIFRQQCPTCHSPDTSRREVRNRKEWGLLIASLQNRLYDEAVGNSINTQIDFHTLEQRR